MDDRILHYYPVCVLDRESGGERQRRESGGEREGKGERRGVIDRGTDGGVDGEVEREHSESDISA